MRNLVPAAAARKKSVLTNGDGCATTGDGQSSVDNLMWIIDIEWAIAAVDSCVAQQSPSYS